MAVAVVDPGEKEPGWLSRVLDAVLGFFDAIGSLLMLTLQTLLWMLRPPYRISQLFNQMDFIGVQSVFIVSLTGVFSGMVLALQTTNSLRQFSAEGVVG